MSTKVQLLRAPLHYLDKQQIFTALSGPVGYLDELYLLIERNGRFAGLGELRLNMEFVTGLDPDAMLEAVQTLVSHIDWSADFRTLLSNLDQYCNHTPMAARGLVDMALHDAAAREQGVSVTEFLGGQPKAAVPTNQCIFWCDNQTLVERVQRYVARGFTDIKLRIGIVEFETDLARLATTRTLLPDTGTLAVDVNGSWTPEQALDYLPALAEFDLEYVEQPIAPGQLDLLAQLTSVSPAPIMLDEDITGLEVVDILLALDVPILAHLKIPKLGGIGPVVEAARRLQQSDVQVMIGQMNEGGCASAAVVQAAMAVESRYHELYGADGIDTDPAPGLVYESGVVRPPRQAGLGVNLSTERASPVAAFRS